jgi:hypothetical protein
MFSQFAFQLLESKSSDIGDLAQVHPFEKQIITFSFIKCRTVVECIYTVLSGRGFIQKGIRR